MWNKLKDDNTLLGLVLGILAPLIGFVVYYFIKFYAHQVSFENYLQLFVQNRQLIPPVMSLSVLANAVIFFIYTQTRRDLTANGRGRATGGEGLAIILLKLR